MRSMPSVAVETGPRSMALGIVEILVAHADASARARAAAATSATCSRDVAVGAEREAHAGVRGTTHERSCGRIAIRDLERDARSARSARTARSSSSSVHSSCGIDLAKRRRDERRMREDVDRHLAGERLERRDVRFHVRRRRQARRQVAMEDAEPATVGETDGVQRADAMREAAHRLRRQARARARRASRTRRRAARRYCSRSSRYRATALGESTLVGASREMWSVTLGRVRRALRARSTTSATVSAPSECVECAWQSTGRHGSSGDGGSANGFVVSRGARASEASRREDSRSRARCARRRGTRNGRGALGHGVRRA